MTHALQRRLFFAAALLLLLAGACLWVFTAATARGAVERELERRSGARVELAALERRWLPPGIVLHKATFVTPAYRLEVARLEVRLSLLAWLRGGAGLDRLVLSNARLELKEGALALPELPPDASWDIRRLSVLGPVGDQVEPLFYLDHAALDTVDFGGHRLELAGGASPAESAGLRIQGRFSDAVSRGLPAGELELRLDGLPAQPLLGYLTGDALLLRESKLHGTATLASKEGGASLAGSLRASAPDRDELLAADFRLQATAEEMTLKSLTGHLVGNRLAARGTLRRWREADPEGELKFELREARLKDDTLHFLHEALGREALGFAERLRGPFSAELEFEFAPGRRTLTGHVDLHGLSAAASGFPPVSDLRGRLHLTGTRLRLENVTGRLLDSPARISGEIHSRQLALRLTADELPLARLPAAFGADLPVENLTGGVQLAADLHGDLLSPGVSGTAALAGAGFDFRGVEVRDLEGEIAFDARQARFESVRGRAGDCGFVVAGRVAPERWQETLEARALVPDCTLRDLARLAEQAGFGPVPLLDPEAFAGSGRLTADYEEQQWRAELDLDGARWQPAGLGLPVEDLRGQLRLDVERLQLRRLSGRLGEFSLLLRGEISRAQPWQVELETTLAPADAERLLPAAWRRWLQVPATFDARAQLRGAPGAALAVEAQLATPPVAAAAPAVVPRLIELEGLWQAPVFKVRRFTARLGAAELAGDGEVRWSQDTNVALRLRAPSGTPLAELLSFLRPAEGLAGTEGAVGVDLKVTGPPEALAWTGTVDLEEVSVPGLLTKPVRLNGRLNLSPGRIELQGVEVAQPLGRFTLSGQLRAQGLSELEARGDWLNLDRLLSQWAKRQLSEDARAYLARHPLDLAVRIEQVRFLEAAAANVRGRVEQRAGEFRLVVERFDFGTGTGRLSARLDPARDSLGARLTLENTPTEKALTDVLKMDPAVQSLLSAEAELAGPLAGRQEFLRGASGTVRFDLGRGRITKGTLPERLFALAVLMNEGVYGFGILRLARLANPPDLRRFHDWTGTIELEKGKARIETHLAAHLYELELQGDLDLASGAFQLHGEGDFHPSWQPDLSLKSVVDGLARLLQRARGQKGKPFEFDLSGELGGEKRVQNFRFK